MNLDFMTIIGLTMGLGVIYYVMAQGGVTNLLFNRDAALLVYGGTMGSILITYPWSVLRHAPKALYLILFPPKSENPRVIIQSLVRMAELSKRAGIAALQDELKNIKSDFLVDGIQMVIDGLSGDVIRENLLKEIEFVRKRHHQISGVFRSMGTYAPIFGLLGTLLGVVQVLKNITDPKAMGDSMAIAVTATFYGIAGANFLFLPIAGKLNAHTEEELLLKEVSIEGILSIQNGEIPLLVSRRLQSFLAYRMRQKKIQTSQKAA